MLTSSRLLTAIFVSATLGCSASAKVTRTTPVASLQSYKVVGVRAKGGYNLSRVLASQTVAQLSRQCQFTNVELSDYSRSKPDLVLDLKIHRSWRGGSGLIQNQNKATVDVLMVLSDGIDRELLGSAWIRGTSASLALNVGGRPQAPEEDALGAVAKTVAAILKKSGCTGQRIARVVDPPTTIAKNTSDTGNGNPDNKNPDNKTPDNKNPDNKNPDNKNPDNKNPDNTTADDGAARAKAEQLNDEGKKLFIAADIASAVSKFEAAAATHPDPRYDFNICLGYESLKRYADAISMCKRVLSKQPSPKLRDKATKRLKIIADLEKKSK